MSNFLRNLKVYIFGPGKMKDGPIVTNIVLCICILMYVIQMLVSSKYGEVNSSIILGAYYRNYVIILNQYWRLFTYGLLHGSIWHLLMNMNALVNLGRSLEKMIGSKKYLICLILSTLCGGMVIHITSSEFVVGISGGLYGLLGLLTVIAYRANWFGVPQIRDSFIRTALMNIIISLLPNVSLAGHLGGFIMGAFLGFIYTTNENEKHSVYYYNRIISCAILLIVLGVFTVRSNETKQYYRNDFEVLEVYSNIGLDYDKAINKYEQYFYGGR